MPRYCSKKVSKRTKSSSQHEVQQGYQPDPQACCAGQRPSKANKINETVLVREINKVIKKTKSRPIDTHCLLKNE